MKEYLKILSGSNTSGPVTRSYTLCSYAVRDRDAVGLVGVGRIRLPVSRISGSRRLNPLGAAVGELALVTAPESKWAQLNLLAMRDHRIAHIRNSFSASQVLF